ncbi:hypothetical protein CLV63_13715 [Murinocardiopsis flavida]|uniref:Uncharacterized protein n=1 Tax=Murinocardiopsis flavida TaxID=645275 RepID=A0A2P8CLV5_9ACTN|nr:hypothetical protein [Murinocardiopsis flavida]PSK85956.1 hypothetical protein CLV63_13715 [Murinocardiopsis flavida]
MSAFDARHEPLRFGYTLAAIDDIASNAAATVFWRGSLDRRRRTETAWSAIAELLYSAEEAPTRNDLFCAAWDACRSHARKDNSFHGWRQGYDAGTMRAYERFWALAANPCPGPESGVVERIALAQIWARLTPTHRRVLLALAAHEDYTRASEAIGVKYHSFLSMISKARRAFLALWHEGEEPSRPWGSDVRGKQPRTASVTSVAVRLRRRNRAKNGITGAPPRRVRAKRDIGVSDEELARRYRDGESITSIAASVGLAKSTVHVRIGPHLHA